MRRIDSSAEEGSSSEDSKSATSSSAGTEDGRSSSDDEEITIQRASRGAKRKRPMSTDEVPAPQFSTPARVEGAPSNAQSFGNPWQWMCPPWMPGQQCQTTPWTVGGQSSSAAYPGPWMQAPLLPQDSPATTPNPNSAARSARRQKKRLLEDVSGHRVATGRNPNQVQVKVGGEIDGGCEGKNAWDLAVRTFVPRILDLGVIDWDEQKPEALRKLRESLDAEFDYLGCPLSMQGFKNAISRFLKTERSRLKARFRSGDLSCPHHVEPRQWKALKDYWRTNSQVEKASRMSMARQKVTQVSQVGRKGKAGREAILKKTKSSSPGLTEISEGLEAMETGSPAKLGTAARLLAVESAQTVLTEKVCNIEAKMSQLLANSSTDSATLQDVKKWLSRLISRDERIEQCGVASPSQSALETMDSGFVVQEGPPFNSGFVVQERAAVPSRKEVDDMTIQELEVQNKALKTVTFKIPAPVGAATPVSSDAATAATTPAAPNPKALTSAPATVDLDSPVKEKDTVAAQSEGEREEKAIEAEVQQIIERLHEDGIQVSKSASTNPAESQTDVVQGAAQGLMEASTVREASGATSPKAIDAKKLKKRVKSPVRLNDSVGSGEEGCTQKNGGSRDLRMKKRDDQVEHKFAMGQEVHLMNPRSVRQKVATGKISGIGGSHKFHFMSIPEKWFKVDISEAHAPQVNLMFENANADQKKVKDAVGSNAIWDGKYMKVATLR